MCSKVDWWSFASNSYIVVVAHLESHHDETSSSALTYSVQQWFRERDGTTSARLQLKAPKRSRKKKRKMKVYRISARSKSDSTQSDFVFVLRLWLLQHRTNPTNNQWEKERERKSADKLAGTRSFRGKRASIVYANLCAIMIMSLGFPLMTTWKQSHKRGNFPLLQKCVIFFSLNSYKFCPY